MPGTLLHGGNDNQHSQELILYTHGIALFTFFSTENFYSS